ncbi:MAG TPA: hypothetical protein VGT60_09730 [Candidatus Limnocylindria bacterium]|nr:hypothetical protein [Candidatus Limnocylindria bacterium]
MPKLPPKALALAVVVALGACATVSPAAPRTPTAFVIPTELPNGRVEITVSPAYALGAAATIPLAIVVARGTVTGPLSARVMASGINEAGSPAEVLVRELAVAPATVTAGTRRSTTVTWDTRDAKGAVVPADAYSLVIEVRVDDAGASRIMTAGATLELR